MVLGLVFVSTGGGFVLGAVIRYEWNSSGGMEVFWAAGLVGAGIGLAVGIVVSVLFWSRERRTGRRLTR